MKMHLKVCQQGRDGVQTHISVDYDVGRQVAYAGQQSVGAREMAQLLVDMNRDENVLLRAPPADLPRVLAILEQIIRAEA